MACFARQMMKHEGGQHGVELSVGSRRDRCGFCDLPFCAQRSALHDATMAYGAESAPGDGLCRKQRGSFREESVPDSAGRKVRFLNARTRAKRFQPSHMACQSEPKSILPPVNRFSTTSVIFTHAPASALTAESGQKQDLVGNDRNARAVGPPASKMPCHQRCAIWSDC